MKIFHLGVWAVTASLCLTPLASAKDVEAGISSGRALQLLMNGNQRFVKESGRHDHRDQAHRLTVAKR